MSNTSPIPHPEWRILLRKRDALKSQITEVLTDIHTLNDARPIVMGRYAEAFSNRLFKLHEIEIEAARLKREAELLQANINCGREIDYEKIQSTLDAEFAEWEARLVDEIDDLTHYRGMMVCVLDANLTRRLRNCFRMLARRLHPDLHPEQSPADSELWHRVLAAYEAQDVDQLDALELITRASQEAEQPDSIDDLQECISKLSAQFDRLLAAFSLRRKEWPFDQLSVLDDPAAVVTRQAELDQRITTTQAVRDERSQWLNQLLAH